MYTEVTPGQACPKIKRLQGVAAESFYRPDTLPVAQVSVKAPKENLTTNW